MFDGLPLNSKHYLKYALRFVHLLMSALTLAIIVIECYIDLDLTDLKPIKFLAGVGLIASGLSYFALMKQSPGVETDKSFWILLNNYKFYLSIALTPVLDKLVVLIFGQSGFDGTLELRERQR